MPAPLEAQIAALRTEKRNTALYSLAVVYSLLAALFVAAYALTALHWLWIVPLMGLVQYYIVISGHEAVHRTLCYPERLNEFFGVFGQALVGVNFTAYRQQHIDHHRCRHHDDDPDSHIYHSVISTPKGWRRVFKLTLGTFIEILIKIHQKGTGGYGTERRKSQKTTVKMKRDTGLVVLAQLGLMALCNLAVGGCPLVAFESSALLQLPLDLVWSYAVLWTGPLFCVTVFLNRCRIVIEHGMALQIADQMDSFGGPRIPTVDIVPNALERRIFAPFLFNYHCAHHLFMGVPHYNLPKLHALLRETDHKGHHMVPGGYIGALRRTMNG